MQSDNVENNKKGIGYFSALKTAIANQEEQLVTELLANQSMLDIEKSYLIELAEVNQNANIIKILKAIPIKE